MTMRCQNIEFENLAKEPTFRSDTGFIFSDMVASQNEYYCFDELFEFVTNGNVDIAQLGVFKYAEISNVSSDEEVSPIILDMDEQNDLNANYFKKITKGDIITVKEDDILISKVRPYLRKILLINDSNSDIYYTSSFIHIRPRKSPRLLFYLFKGYFINYLNSISRQGKGYPTLTDRDLHYMKFEKTVVDKVLSNEEEILSEITNLEEQIASLKQTRIPDSKIIDSVFEKRFQWNYLDFQSQKNIKNFNVAFSAIANNYDLRMSAKFHRPAGSFVYSDIEKADCLRIKNFITEPITLGASVSPDDFDSCGECYYISMATVKNFKVELDDTQLLSEKYVLQPKNSKKKVQKGDIIMTRSGAAIGKFALVEDDINAIHADFTMKIRLKNINLLFAYYYFRSVYFQYLIEINYKGLQNNNIFPNQIQEFPIPIVPLEQQNDIVEEIKNAIDTQNENKHKIQMLRNRIDVLIEEVICGR